MNGPYGLVETDNPLIYRVRVPVPYPLKYVNAYLISGDRGWTVIDPGIHTQDAEEVWEGVWTELGSGFRQVDRIVLTHHHPDHYGLAGWFQARSGAPVFLSEKGRLQANRLWGKERTLTEEIWQLFKVHGMDKATADEMIPHLEGFVGLVEPQPEIAVITDGDMLQLGDANYEAIETGGHAAGHLSFYRKETGEILCGDAVLPYISPNVSYIPGMEEDPLASFMEGLEHLSGYRVERAYPGHRDPFHYFTTRCLDLIQHHERRLEHMLQLVEERPCTTYECCIRLFGTKLSIHQLRFAMAETLAHLLHLERKGKLLRQERGDVIVYTAAARG